MDHLHRELSPVSQAAWEQIEAEAKSRIVPLLAARTLVDFAGPHGWGHSASDLGRVEEVEGPVDGVSAARRRVLPLVELRAYFSVSRSELDDADRGATDLELDELDEAVYQMALAENTTVFHGYRAGEMVGITERSSHESLALEDMEQYPKVVARATDRLRRAGVAGPYGLAIGPEIYTSIVETAEHGGHLLLDHLRQILDGPVVWAPGIGGGVVLSLRGGDFVLECGEDLSIGFRDHDRERVTLYLEESISFRVLDPSAAVALRREDR